MPQNSFRPGRRYPCWQAHNHCHHLRLIIALLHACWWEKIKLVIMRPAADSSAGAHGCSPASQSKSILHQWRHVSKKRSDSSTQRKGLVGCITPSLMSCTAGSVQTPCRTFAYCNRTETGWAGGVKAPAGNSEFAVPLSKPLAPRQPDQDTGAPCGAPARHPLPDQAARRRASSRHSGSTVKGVDALVAA